MQVPKSPQIDKAKTGNSILQSAPMPRARYWMNICLLITVTFGFVFLKGAISDWNALYLIEGVQFELQEANYFQFLFSIGGGVRLYCHSISNLPGLISFVTGRDSPQRFPLG